MVVFMKFAVDLYVLTNEISQYAISMTAKMNIRIRLETICIFSILYNYFGIQIFYEQLPNI